MININECDSLQLMPEALKKSAKVQAASFALAETIRMLLKKIDQTSVYARIDTMPEKIVDLLAVELRTQYYDEDISLAEKRSLVKSTLSWYCKAGTPAAMQELIQIVFGNQSTVEEWWQYGGDPYMFKIIVDDQESLLTKEKWDKVVKSIHYVKNARSHLESILYLRAGRQKLHAGIGAGGYTLSVIG